MVIKDEYFYEYRSLKNHMRRLKLDDTLFVIWSYAQNLQFGRPIGTSIEVIPEYNSSKHWVEKRVYPWALEILTKEAILHCSETFATETLKKWDYFAKANNKLKFLGDKISQVHTTQSNVLHEVHRIAHQQFIWQGYYPNSELLIRHYKIFNTDRMRGIIEEETGLSLDKVFLIGSAFIGLSLKYVALRNPPNINIPGITNSDVDLFLKLFSKDIDDLRDILSDEIVVDDTYEYKYSSLRAYPIIKMKYNGENHLVFPIPTLLFWRFTSGIFYEICNHRDFSSSFGSSFQEYIGDVIRKSIRGFQVFPEQEYRIGSNREDTADWIVIKDKASLFIECKTKRLRFEAKFENIDSNALEKEIDKIAQAILQLYKTIIDYKNGHYLSSIPQDLDKVIPLVVTLEDWFLWGDYLNKILNKKVVKYLESSDIPLRILKDMPYSLCSVKEFEDMAQIINIVGITNYFDPKFSSQEMVQWAYGTYTSHQFPEECKNLIPLFKDDYDKLFKDYK